MSHTTQITSVRITDINALESAAEKLRAEGVNCQIVRDQKPRMYYENQHGKCDYVLSLPDSRYDVGFDKQEDGSYVPVYDEWANQIKDQIGAACPVDNEGDRSLCHIGKFMQYYAVDAAINAATAQGYYVESAETDEQGNVQLVIGTEYY